MSGHNKWTQIKHKKGAVDAKKSKVFSMLSKTITVEARKAKGDKNYPSLRAAIDRARAANMPSDNIERAVARGAGLGAAAYEEVLYEAYGPGGIALVIEGITDNKNRTTPEIKHLLSENGGTLGGQGSAVWAFTKNGEGWLAQNPMSINDQDQEKLTTLIEKLDDHDDIKNVYTNAA